MTLLYCFLSAVFSTTAGVAVLVWVSRGRKEAQWTPPRRDPQLRIKDMELERLNVLLTAAHSEGVDGAWYILDKNTWEGKT